VDLHSRGMFPLLEVEFVILAYVLW